MEHVNNCSLYQRFTKIAQTVNQRIDFSFGNINFLLEDITPQCLQITELDQLDCKKLFRESFLTPAIRCWDWEKSKNCGQKTI